MRVCTTKILIGCDVIVFGSFVTTNAGSAYWWWNHGADFPLISASGPPAL